MKRYLDTKDGWILEVDAGRERWRTKILCAGWGDVDPGHKRPQCVQLTALVALLYGYKEDLDAPPP